ncbi:MAG: class I SAM-dependent methyltransferase, partial [bacterium]
MLRLIDPPTLEKKIHPDQDYYRPFTNVARRDVMQETLEVPAVIRIMKLPCNKKMLEVGCGPGFALIPLAKLCKPTRLVGIDIDTGSLADAQKRLKTKLVSAEL